ncbi:CvpA family protein [Thermanaerovibrio acidaminovorans]|uniref:CvpA family protein n=1 Tax=Thermanaerovibrio acidaminovorans TaxID=81462 RepID=UPI00249222DC|nr:CvpA family protein [Thermanaerovibrio acidaminovorans]
MSLAMSGLDWGIALVGLIWIAKGFLRGFSREVASMAGWALGLFLSVELSDHLEPLVMSLGLVESPWACRALAAVGLLVFALLVARLVGGLLRGILLKAHLSALDRLMGGAVGLAKLALLVAVSFVVANALSPFLPQGWEDRSLFMRMADRHRELILGAVYHPEGEGR